MNCTACCYLCERAEFLDSINAFLTMHQYLIIFFFIFQGLTKHSFFIEPGKDVSLFTIENLKDKVFEEALTVYPMKSGDSFYLSLIHI